MFIWVYLCFIQFICVWAKCKSPTCIIPHAVQIRTKHIRRYLWYHRESKRQPFMINDWFPIIIKHNFPHYCPFYWLLEIASRTCIVHNNLADINRTIILSILLFVERYTIAFPSNDTLYIVFSIFYKDNLHDIEWTFVIWYLICMKTECAEWLF